MQKLNLLKYALLLILLGIRIDYIKKNLDKRINKKIDANKSLSDKKTIRLAERLEKNKIKWKHIEHKYNRLYNKLCNL